MQKHNFHLVTESPWPLVTSFCALFIPTSAVLYMHSFDLSPNLFFISFSLILFIAYAWWSDIIREGTFIGDHTDKVQISLRAGMLLFIVSEVMFFFAFFWAFFHSSMNPVLELGGVWPPIGIYVFNPWGVPLLNTLILLTSGATITLAHHAILANKKFDTLVGFFLTIVLAGFFTFLQYLEYCDSTFSIFDSVYGSTFFLATGFHGFHVLIGTIFIIVNFLRFFDNQFTVKHHYGFEAAAWYWHFVDVVWLFLFVAIYWWGSGII